MGQVETLIAKVRMLGSGQRLCYHEGNLARDRQEGYTLGVIADEMWKAQASGRFILFQQRIKDGFRYFIGRI